jgi:hypothetical protein
MVFIVDDEVTLTTRELVALASTQVWMFLNCRYRVFRLAPRV